jgi:hypothetical protein
MADDPALLCDRATGMSFLADSLVASMKVVTEPFRLCQNCIIACKVSSLFKDEDVWLGYFQTCRSHIRRSVIEYCNGLITKVLNNGFTH